MKKVRFGILSTARIGVEKVIPAMQHAPHCEIVAIASRKLESAQAAAKKLGIPRAYGSYDELLVDAHVDAVYNPLPNHLHVEWSLKALAAGKHVLCEKPIALSADEGQKLVNAAHRLPHLKVMEAFMYRHHPQWQTARQLVSDGKIGRLRAIQSVLRVLQCRSEQHPQSGGHRRRGTDGHRLLSDLALPFHLSGGAAAHDRRTGVR